MTAAGSRLGNKGLKQTQQQEADSSFTEKNKIQRVIPAENTWTASRALGETQVDVYLYGDEGTCQIRRSLDTLYTGEAVAFGAFFTVKALTHPLDIQGFEFANVASNSNHQVKLYARKGNTFSSDTNDWVQLTSTMSVTSSDGLGAVVPRADIVESISLQPGDEYVIYITLDDGHLILDKSDSDTGSVYQEDDFLQLFVGESLGDGPEFLAQRTANRAFQGKIHYRVLTPCNNLVTETNLVFPFAVEPGTEPRDLNTAVSEGFDTLLAEEADLARWNLVHGLTITGVSLKSKGTLDNCSQYGFNSGCELYDTDLQLRHYESLGSRELILEFMQKFNFQNGLGDDVDSDLNIVYIGGKVLQQTYNILLVGVPLDTVLNPIQRRYLESVTFDFLDDFSDVTPYRVEIGQAVDDESRRRRMLLRRGQRSFDTMDSRLSQRSLAGLGLVRLEATIFGIGDDLDEFREDIEMALLDNTAQYRTEIQKQQYLPGDINDETNFGDIFAELEGTTVNRQLTSSEEASTDTSNGGMSADEIQIIVFSSVLALSFLYLVYRVLRDCVFVQDGWRIKKQLLSEKIGKEPTGGVAARSTRPELENMDKPRQKPSKESISAIDIAKLKAFKEARPEEPATPARRGRKPPAMRGVDKSKSFDTTLFHIDENSTEGARREPFRGVKRNKSTDLPTRSTNKDSDFMARKPQSIGDIGSRTLNSEKSDNSSSERSCSRSFHGRLEPAQRGVGRARSSDGVNLTAERSPQDAKSASSHSRQGGRPPPATRGVKKSNTFSGVEQFVNTVGASQNTSQSSAPGETAPLPKSAIKQNDILNAKKRLKRSANSSTEAAPKATGKLGVGKKGKKKPKKAMSSASNGSITSQNGSQSPSTTSVTSGLSSQHSVQSNVAPNIQVKHAPKQRRGMKSENPATGVTKTPKTPKKASVKKVRNRNSGENSFPGVPLDRPPRPMRVDMSGQTT